MLSSFPPSVPTKLQGKIIVEVVDADTIRLKLPDGTVLKTLTRAEYESAFQAPAQVQG